MAYAGLPEGATVFEGLPEGAQVLPPDDGVRGEMRQPTNSEIDKFISDTGSFKERLKQGFKNAYPAVSNFVRPTVEGGSAILGAIAGAPAAIPTFGASSVAGTALGYGIGKNLMDTVDEFAGVKPERSLLQRITDTGGDLATGATMEMGGQVLGKGIGYGIDKFKAARVPFTAPATEAKAATVFKDTYAPEPPPVFTASNAEIAAANAARQKETERLLKRINATETPTPAQASGDVRAAFTEQSLAAKDPALAESLKFKDAKLNQAAQDNLTRTLGTGDSLPAIQPAAITGENTTAAIQGALTPIKSAEAELWGKVPNYPLPTTSIDSAFTETLAVPSTARDAISKIKTVYDEIPHDVLGLQTVEREINSAIKNGTDTEKHFLGQLKRAINADFNAMGTAAEAGDVALFEGQIVRPSQIQTEIKALEAQAQKETAAGLTIQEKNDHLYKALMDNNYGAGISQNVNVAPQQQADSLAKALQYMQKQGKMLDYTPPTGGIRSQTADNINAGIAAKQNILDNLQPAEDVAAAYKAAKQFSKEQHFDRFGTPSVDSVLKLGEQSTGLSLRPETIPAKFFTPTGAQDLIKSLGSKQLAAEQMAPHALEQITTKSVKPDGTMDIQRAMAWVRQNKPTLDNLGLTKQMHETVKGQIPQAIRAQLDSKGIDMLSNPVMGAREAAKFVRQYTPAMQQLYGNSSKELLAMQDYGKMLEILSRNKNVSYSGGSTSIEKLFMAAPEGSLAKRITKELATALAGGTAGFMTAGPIGGVVGVGAGTVIKEAAKMQKETMMNILREAITNPEAADLLMDIAKKRIKPASINNRLQTVLGYSAFKESANGE